MPSVISRILPAAFLAISATFAVAFLATAAHHEDEAAAAPPKLTMGNGQKNWITTEGATREGATLTFKEVHIDGPGWLVMHPFKDGKPQGDIYVGATYLEDGKTQDVAITVEPEPKTGDMFIVMLHSDVNDNQEFDFVFVDERNVLDKAVFEGPKMIGHAIPSP